MEKQPNILFLMADEWRGDCLGAAGHPDVKTPYLDTLAARGVLYTHTYSACPTCVPARAALHTGLTPRHTGRVGYQDRVDWNYGCTLAGELAKAGYYTQCVGKMHVHPLRHTLGFCNVELHDGYLHAYNRMDVPYGENQAVADDYFYWLKNEKGIACSVTDTGLDCNGWSGRPWPYEERLHPTNWVAERSIDFLRRRDPRRPFFLMASFVRPHAPYDAPQAFWDLYQGRSLRPPAAGDWDDTELRQREGMIYDSAVGPRDPDAVHRQQAGYYACISHVDNQIGRILAALDEHGLRENTVILFASDHGQMLSDHCLSRKSLPYEGSAHIPLLMAGSARWLGTPGRRDDRLVELRDIMPTLLALAGAPIPTHLDGQDLLHSTPRTWLHGEHAYSFHQLSNQFIVTPHDKLIWFPEQDRFQYFDLAADPAESHNAIADRVYAQRVEVLKHILAQELKNAPEGYSDGERLLPGGRPVNCLPSATLANLGPWQ